MNFLPSGMLSVLLVSLCSIIFSSCAPLQIQLNKIPEQEPTAKLRVFVLPVSHPRSQVNSVTVAAYHWGIPDEEFARDTIEMVGKFLHKTGIYEVIPQSDLERVVGKRSIEYWKWKWNDWELAKRVGKALHADYIFISEREAAFLLLYRKYFINLVNGKQYFHEDNQTRNYAAIEKTYAIRDAIMRESYRYMFSVMKADLFETALRKGRMLEKYNSMPDKTEMLKSGQYSQIFAAYIENQKSVVVSDFKPPIPLFNVLRDAPLQRLLARQDLIKHLESITKIDLNRCIKLAGEPVPVKKTPQDLNKAQRTTQIKKESPHEKTRIVVHDFTSPKYLEVATLILTEALREELFNMGTLILVNRDQMIRAMDELKLQYSGLLDEKQAVSIGNWLSAHEMVTGRLATLGQIQMLSARRTDIGSLKALGMSSIKCPVGREEELLNGIPEMAKKLVAGIIQN